MKSLINPEQNSLIKTKVNEKAEETHHLFQADGVNHNSLNEEMKWL